MELGFNIRAAEQQSIEHLVSILKHIYHGRTNGGSLKQKVGARRGESVCGGARRAGGREGRRSNKRNYVTRL